MNRRKTLLSILALFCLCCGTAFGQPQSDKEWTAKYDARFLKQDPQVGTTIPDVAAFDGNGKPFQLSSTRGKYTVIVFGCLT